MKRTISFYFATLLLFCIVQSGQAQEKALSAREMAASIDLSDNDDDRTAGKEASSSSNSQASPECKFCRWFELQTGSISFRYRTIVDSIGTRTFNQLQHRELLAGRFKFDAKGKYTINAHASSGYYFNWAYAGTGWGGGMPEAFFKGASGLGVPPAIARLIADLAPDSDGGNFWVRQLYIEAKPVRGLEFQYGSLPILRGQHSETTSFDEDGYVAGGRLSIKRPEKFFFDEISVTYAYLGKTERITSLGKREVIDDVYRPNFFRRWQHLGNSNYHQFLVQKKVGERLNLSTDYTYHERNDFMRGAARINTTELKVLDWVRLEAYQRIGDNTFMIPGFFGAPPTPYTTQGKFGYSIHGEKKVGQRFAVGGGLNDIDYDYGNNGAFYTIYNFALNGDRMGVGKRFYLTTNLKLTNSLSLSTFATKAFDVPSNEILFNRTHINAAITWDFLKTLKRTDWF